MTLINIITRALIELGRNTDAQSMDAWHDKFCQFANDGVRDLAEYMELRRVEDAVATDGKIDVKQLKRGCIKVLGVKQDGAGKSFTFADTTGYINTSASDGPVQVNYRYNPAEMANDIDSPDIPEALQHLLPTYVVYREYLTLDPSMQQRAGAAGNLYMTGKLHARKTLGENDTYRIYNYGW